MTRLRGPQRRCRVCGDCGLGLVEVLVTMVLLSVLSLIVLTAVVGGYQSMRHGDDEADGLADVRKVTERLGRDVRNARGVAAGADGSHLVLWVDANSDYKQQDAETITWELQASSRPGQYDVVRSIRNGGSQLEATTVISNLAFAYDAVAPATRLVTTTIRYDATTGRGALERTTTFSHRLRNVK